MASTSALAADANDADDHAITRARSALESVDYATALAAVRPLLSAPSEVTRANALEITAIAELLLGHLTEGRRAVDALFTLAPGFELEDPTLPPRVTLEFDSAATRQRPRSVTVSVRADNAALSTFALVAGGLTSRVELACRSSPQEPFAPVTMNQAGGAWRFRLEHGAVSCHATAFDAAGVPVGRLGTRARPVDVTVTEHVAPTAERQSLATRWWIWTGVGVVAVAAVAVAVVATRPGTESSAPKADATIAALRGAGISW